MKRCEECHKTKLIPLYCASLKIPLSHIFEIYSFDFAGTFPKSKNRKNFLLIAVEHLTGLPINLPTEDKSTRTVAQFMETEILLHFGPPKTILSENAGFFTAASLLTFLGK